MTVLAVFRSRSQTLDFLSRLRNAGVPSQAVNTPREAGVGCGISAKFDDNFMNRARAILDQYPYSSFSGFLSGTQYYGK